MSECVKPSHVASITGYTDYGCRCRRCKGAARAAASRGLEPGDSRHGTVAGYSRGCRCDECSAAKSIYNREYQRANRWPKGISRPECCPVCGVALDYTGPRSETTPACDRLLPGSDYTVEGCWIICEACNRRKDNSTPPDLYQIADAVWAEMKRRGMDPRKMFYGEETE